MYYQMNRQYGENGAFLHLKSHWNIRFNCGNLLTQLIKDPLIKFKFEKDPRTVTLPTIFTTPLFVAKNLFINELKEIGIDNIEVFPAELSWPESNLLINDYSVVNIIGLIAAADMDKSTNIEIGPDINLIDKIVLKKNIPLNFHIFRLKEDPVNIIVDETVVSLVKAKKYFDIYLEELTYGRSE